MEIEVYPVAAEELDFRKEKVQPVTLGQLRRTVKENDVFGKPLRGMYHYEMIESLMDACESAGLHCNVREIFAAQGGDRKSLGVNTSEDLELQFGRRAVEATVLRRIFANIDITDFDDGEFSTSLALAFHQRGIQVGLGNQVYACHNQCIVSADHLLSTYNLPGLTNGRMDGAIAIIDQVKKILANASARIEEERKQIVALKNQEVTTKQFHYITGALVAERVIHDTTDKTLHQNIVYPMNSGQINAFAETGLRHLAGHNNELSMWDVYNFGTQQHKADSMDIPSLMPQNLAFWYFVNRADLLEIA